jgi:hypothetical protein
MAYAERKNTLSKKDIAAMSKWANRPRAATPETQQPRRDLWDALHDFIRKDGGAIVSVKYTWPIRFEVAPDAGMATRLRELGHDPIFCEQATRIGAPVFEPGRWGRTRDMNTGYSFRTVDVFELKLPK